MNKKKKSFSSKIWFIVLLAVLLSTGSICVVSFLQAGTAIINSTKQRMLDLANCASGSVDGDILEKLTKEDIDTPEYKIIYDRLAVFRDNIESEYVYGIKKEDDGRFTFSVDPAIEDPGEFGSEVVRTDALVAAGNGIPSVDEEPYTDAWGTFYSAYSPVFDSSNKVAGIIGVDFSREWVEGQQSEQATKTIVLYLVIIVVILAVVGFICYVQIKSITKPIERITSVAERYQSGDFSERIEMDRADELGVLSKALQSMATSLTEQLSEAEASSLAKSEFFSGVSNDICAPINEILETNEKNLRASSDRNVLANSENIRTTGLSLLNIINNTLVFSKIEAGKIEIVPVDYDLSLIVSDLMNMIYAKALNKGLKLEFDFDSNTPKLINGDEKLVRLIISNILINAVNYTKEGSVKFSIGFEKVDSEPDSIFLNVSVKDTGTGIHPEDMEKLFLKFGMIEVNRNKNVEGTGLGIIITGNLLELMGSSLKVESVYGEGSTFGFSLKQKVVKWEPIGDIENSFRVQSMYRDEGDTGQAMYSKHLESASEMRKPEADPGLMNAVFEEIKSAAEDKDRERIERVFSEMEEYRIPEDKEAVYGKVKKAFENDEYKMILTLLS